jgi:hypothetical protein
MWGNNPFPVNARFRRSLVLTYSCAPEIAAPLVAPGLSLDLWRGHAFLAIAMVRTERLRPAFLPQALGRDFFLAGYRVFVRRGSQRGLQILRSDTDRRTMVAFGNLLTRYHYHPCRFEFIEAADSAVWRVYTPSSAADLEIVERASATLPDGSVFDHERDARRFAGPLPLTFGYDPGSPWLTCVRGVKENWRPRLVGVEVRRCTWLPAEARLAAAYAVQDVAYRWESGVRLRVEAA